MLMHMKVSFDLCPSEARQKGVLSSNKQYEHRKAICESMEYTITKYTTLIEDMHL